MFQTIAGIGILAVALAFGFYQWKLLCLYNRLGDEIAESEAQRCGVQLALFSEEQEPFNAHKFLLETFLLIASVTIFPMLIAFLIVKVGMALGAP